MSIKDQLRAAILSGGATGASPSGEAVSINCKGTVGEWEAISTFVAPANGYAQIQGKSTDVGGIATLTSTSGYAGMNWATMGLHFGFSLPVKKGETVTCQGARLANITVQMLKLVGGGKNPVAQLIRRVVPCLRNCLTRALTRTLKAKRTGSGSNLFRLPQPSNINGHRAIGMKSFLLKRGGFPFELRVLGTLKSLNLVLLRTIRPFQCQPYPGTMDTSERPFLSGKGFRSKSRSQGTSLRPVFASGFIGLRAEPNLCFGGASHG